MCVSEILDTAPIYQIMTFAAKLVQRAMQQPFKSILTQNADSG